MARFLLVAAYVLSLSLIALSADIHGGGGTSQALDYNACRARVEAAPEGGGLCLLVVNPYPAVNDVAAYGAFARKYPTYTTSEKESGVGRGYWVCWKKGGLPKMQRFDDWSKDQAAVQSVSVQPVQYQAPRFTPLGGGVVAGFGAGFNRFQFGGGL